MAVWVIDTLKPKNGLDFPVVEAVDVAVEGYLNLADAVTHFATDTAITAINVALNSKANVSDVTASVQNLQGQIDQIVISASAESVVAPEVAAARVGQNGTEYTTLKERLDAEITPLVKLGYGVVTFTATGQHSSAVDQIPFSLSTGEQFDITAISDVDAIDRVIVHGYSGSSDTTIGTLQNTGKTYTLTSNGNYDRIGFYMPSFNTTVTTTVIAEKRQPETTAIKEDVDDLYYAAAEIPTSLTSNVSLGTGGSPTPNNRLFFFGNSQATAREFKKGDTIIVKGGADYVAFTTYIGGVTQSYNRVLPPTKLTMSGDGKLRMTFSKLTDTQTFSDKSDEDGKIIVVTSLVDTINANIDEINRIQVYSPIGADTGATLGSGGTMAPNNRLNFFPTNKKLKLKKYSSLIVDAKTSIDVDFVVTANGTTTDTGWLTTPQTFTAEYDDTEIRLIFKHKVDGTAFESTDELDGYVHIVENMGYNFMVLNNDIADIHAEIDALNFEENIYPHLISNARYKADNPLTLLHFSDIHGDTAALARIMNDYEDNSSLIDDVICTGDLVANTSAEISTWWDSRVLTCIGNHDSATSVPAEQGYYDWTGLSMANRDAYYIAPFESGWDIVHTSGKSYYYKDYADNKLRLIVIDAMLYTGGESEEGNTQTDWISSTIDAAMQNNYHVLIATHSPHGGSEPVDCSFSKYNETTMPTQLTCNLPDAVVNLVAEKIESGLHFAGYIVGHTHQDNIWDCTGDGTQYAYCVTCAAVAQAAQWAFSDQHRSTTEDAYNIITIDTTNSLVKIIRGGGANIDRMMRDRKYMCIDYANGTLISG